jgi:hypothetical protein
VAQSIGIQYKLALKLEVVDDFSAIYLASTIFDSSRSCNVCFVCAEPKLVLRCSACCIPLNSALPKLWGASPGHRLRVP